jgi:hypothetical protein
MPKFRRKLLPRVLGGQNNAETKSEDFTEQTNITELQSLILRKSEKLTVERGECGIVVKPSQNHE